VDREDVDQFRIGRRNSWEGKDRICGRYAAAEATTGSRSGWIRALCAEWAASTFGDALVASVPLHKTIGQLSQAAVQQDGGTRAEDQALNARKPRKAARTVTLARRLILELSTRRGGRYSDFEKLGRQP
jgi:hypothetical protein